MDTARPDLALRPLGPIARSTYRYRVMGLTLTIWFVVVALVLTRGWSLIAIAGALAIGWSHLAGRCGQAHLGALTLQGKLPGRRIGWLVDVAVYVLSGALASVAVGLALGTLGAIIVPSALRGVALTLVLCLAALAAAIELGVIRWRLPEPNRQTRREWRFAFRPPIPAAMWGFGLGLTFATVFTFSGTWLVLAFPIAVGDPRWGATLLVAHWLGRAAPVLAGPLLLDDAGHSCDLLYSLQAMRPVFRASNIVGISLIALALAKVLVVI